MIEIESGEYSKRKNIIRQSVENLKKILSSVDVKDLEAERLQPEPKRNESKSKRG